MSNASSFTSGQWNKLDFTCLMYMMSLLMIETGWNNYFEIIIYDFIRCQRSNEIKFEELFAIKT